MLSRKSVRRGLVAVSTAASALTVGSVGGAQPPKCHPAQVVCFSVKIRRT